MLRRVWCWGVLLCRPVAIDVSFSRHHDGVALIGANFPGRDITVMPMFVRDNPGIRPVAVVDVMVVTSLNCR